LLIVVFNFALPRLMPGDTVLMLVGMDEDASPKTNISTTWKRPARIARFLVQFYDYLAAKYFGGNLGYSYLLQQDGFRAYRAKASQHAPDCDSGLSILSSPVFQCFGAALWYEKSGLPGRNGHQFCRSSQMRFPVFLLALQSLMLMAVFRSS
jgi:hypothetical protein